MILGYTSGVFDLFHIGHVNLLRNAKNMCDKLIVGVSIDELVMEYKNKTPVIPYIERHEIVQQSNYVDAVIGIDTRDRLAIHDKLNFDIMFVGDDWYGSSKWKGMEEQFKERNVRTIYFPYTKGTSSTKLNNILDKFR